MWETILNALLDHLPDLIGLAFTVLAFALAWGLRKMNLSKELENAIKDFVQRGLDKAKVELQLATSPASPGGAKLTEEELSHLRQLIFDYARSELKGPLAKLAFDAARGWGEKRLKGFISEVLKAKGVELSTDAPVGEVVS